MQRPEPLAAGTEAETLNGFLDFLRATIGMKTDGLTREQLDATLAPSTMSLGGLLNHLAYVEDFWATYVFAGEQPSDPWLDAPWDDDPDWDWHATAGLSSAEIVERWRVACERSRATFAGRDMADLAVRDSHGEHHNLRWILTHLIEEYARHAGHADLIRESIDGEVGE